MIMEHDPAGSIHQKMVYCGHEGMEMVRNNAQVDAVVVQPGSAGTEGPKVFQENLPYTFTPSPPPPAAAAWTTERLSLEMKSTFRMSFKLLEEYHGNT